MVWLRSEDLKEEKVVTTSAGNIARPRMLCYLQIKLRSVRNVTSRSSVFVGTKF